MSCDKLYVYMLSVSRTFCDWYCGNAFFIFTLIDKITAIIMVYEWGSMAH